MRYCPIFIYLYNLHDVKGVYMLQNKKTTMNKIYISKQTHSKQEHRPTEHDRPEGNVVPPIRKTIIFISKYFKKTIYHG